MSQHLFGVAGFTAAAADYFYFAVIAEYFIVTGYSFESVRNNTAIHHISI
jgi:hypothetical protein